MRNRPEIIRACLKDYDQAKKTILQNRLASDFEVDFELRYTLFLAAQIDGNFTPREKEFLGEAQKFLNWSSVYDSLLIGKIYKQPSYQIEDIRIAKKSDELSIILYRIAYCMTLIDGTFHNDERFLLDNFKRHLFGYQTGAELARVDLQIAEWDEGDTGDWNRERVLTEAEEAIQKQQEMEKPVDESLEDCLKELDRMIGLSKVKEEVRKLVSFLEIQKKRKEHKLSLSQPTLHMVFTGAPGTGKTTVARVIARIYRALGFLKKGHLIETDRTGLVGQYVGHTELKTSEVINQALDGILFIDEAYSLYKESENDFGQEAIDTLVKRMEDDRERIVVIAAGYQEDMDEFIRSNSGLQSRFNTFIRFENYHGKELFQIFELICCQNEYEPVPAAAEKLNKLFDLEARKARRDFGNGRFVRNLFEKVLRNQAMRLSHSEKELTRKDLISIEPEDIFMGIPEQANDVGKTGKHSLLDRLKAEKSK
ncbi:MAG TPA: AAA family ATPase [Verrucomicrobiales bacterium]|nr:AAA family ATPase [Verrucomicrobiales bacterium]